tara:strand:+ start:141 stop:719 length:579 start_codon:yes stop_codon:yes gene_type:complete
MKKILYIASKNEGKISEYKKMLANINCQLLLQPNQIDIIEDGRDFRENAIKKACGVSIATNSYSLADDSGLCVMSLNNRPGIFSSRYANDDESRIEKLLGELEGEDNREAFFVANLCLSSPEGKIIIDIETKCYGRILFKGRGKNGFGYDPIFEEVNSQLTFAEMSEDLKEKYSHRGRAIAKIIPDLIKIFN